MKKERKKPEPMLRVFFLCFFLSSGVWGKQQDVPEPVFMNFSIQPLYVPTYHGRDPFKPLDNVDRSPQISIVELNYLGVILVGGKPSGLFTWRGNPSVVYTLKSRKLFASGNKTVDGVIGDILDS